MPYMYALHVRLIYTPDMHTCADLRHIAFIERWKKAQWERARRKEALKAAEARRALRQYASEENVASDRLLMAVSLSLSLSLLSLSLLS